MENDDQIDTIVQSICSRGHFRQDIPTVLAMIIEYGLDIELQDKVTLYPLFQISFFSLEWKYSPHDFLFR